MNEELAANAVSAKKHGDTHIGTVRQCHFDVENMPADFHLRFDDGAEQTLQLVGQDEIDVKMGRISWKSPVGGALLGKREGDEVRVTTPAGTRTFTVVEVKYR